MSEKLDVILLGKGSQVWRHHTAGGQVDLVTAGLHLVQHQEWDRSVSGGSHFVGPFLFLLLNYTVI